MRVGAATLAGGIFGLLGTLCFFLAFGTDYWLVASDDCGPYAWPTQTTLTGGKDANRTEIQLVQAVTSSSPPPPSLTLHHEGFFWRCVFQVEPTAHAVLATLFTNQPESKVCVHGYLFPLPVALGQVPHPSYDATAVFRGFWTVLIILGLVAALTGGFLLVCGVPFISHKLFKLGGCPPHHCCLLVPLHSAALRTVDGGCRGEALRPAGERRGVSKRARCRCSTACHSWWRLPACLWSSSLG
ncbi:Transmembrane protein 182 Precursor [Larimichthys crocea]|uniref:Transmembrane protein 182 n=1 Tax=Larimichthys crocea TaxID=215358 RepID=A0A6G0I448_LARCR|nr:Transmembrane protein 182 Precursor [Larimichthys crocea]